MEVIPVPIIGLAGVGRLKQAILIGESSETKPNYGSLFIETDTGILYVRVGGVWTPV
jgi:hypothetical protein